MSISKGDRKWFRFWAIQIQYPETLIPYSPKIRFSDICYQCACVLFDSSSWKFPIAILHEHLSYACYFMWSHNNIREVARYRALHDADCLPVYFRNPRSFELSSHQCSEECRHAAWETFQTFRMNLQLPQSADLTPNWKQQAPPKGRYLFYIYGSVHRCSILIIVQRDATQSSLVIILQVHSTCFGCQPRPR